MRSFLPFLFLQLPPLLFSTPRVFAAPRLWLSPHHLPRASYSKLPALTFPSALASSSLSFLDQEPKHLLLEQPSLLQRVSLTFPLAPSQKLRTQILWSNRPIPLHLSLL